MRWILQKKSIMWLLHTRTPQLSACADFFFFCHWWSNTIAYLRPNSPIHYRHKIIRNSYISFKQRNTNLTISIVTIWTVVSASLFQVVCKSVCLINFETNRNFEMRCISSFMCISTVMNKITKAITQWGESNDYQIAIASYQWTQFVNTFETE